MQANTAAQRFTRPRPTADRKVFGCTAGFTLLEVLISISILALIVSTSYGALQKLLQVKQLLQDEHLANSIGNSVLLRFTREFQLLSSGRKLIPPPGNLKAVYNANVHLVSESRSLGQGRPGDRLTFVALDGGQYLPDGLTHTGFVQITYRVEKDPEQLENAEATYYLIRDEVPLPPPSKEDEETQIAEAYKKIMTFPITKDLVSLRFRFYDAVDQKWVSLWKKDRKYLPQRIMFTFRIKTPQGKIRTFSSVIPNQTMTGEEN